MMDHFLENKKVENFLISSLPFKTPDYLGQMVVRIFPACVYNLATLLVMQKKMTTPKKGNLI